MYLFDKSCKSPKVLQDTAGSSESLSYIYNYDYAKSLKGGFFDKLDALWMSMRVVKAARNRYRMVQSELEYSVSKILEKNPNLKEIKILEVAAGAAEALIEFVAVYKYRNQSSNFVFSITLLDQDANALAKAKYFAESLGLEIKVIEGDITKGALHRLLKAEKFNIIEMIGLSDYFPDEYLRRFFNLLYSGIEKGGFFISANVLKRDTTSQKPFEMFFVHKVVKWGYMFYRNISEFSDMICWAGFYIDPFHARAEKLKFFCVVTAQKK